MRSFVTLIWSNERGKVVVNRHFKWLINIGHYMLL